MNEKSNTINTTQTIHQNYNEYCFNRLPCGLCRLTDKMCPVVSNGTPTITWGVNCYTKE